MNDLKGRTGPDWLVLMRRLLNGDSVSRAAVTMSGLGHSRRVRIVRFLATAALIGANNCAPGSSPAKISSYVQLCESCCIPANHPHLKVPIGLGWRRGWGIRMLRSKGESDVTSKTANLQEGADKSREVLASAHRAAGEGRPIPATDQAGPEPGRVDAVRGRGVDRGSLGQARLENLTFRDRNSA